MVPVGALVPHTAQAPAVSDACSGSSSFCDKTLTPHCSCSRGRWDGFWRQGVTLMKVIAGWASDSLWTTQDCSVHGISSGGQKVWSFQRWWITQRRLRIHTTKSCCISHIFFRLSQTNILAGLGDGDFWWAAMHCSKMLLKHTAFMELVQCEVEFFLVAGPEYEKFISLSSDLPIGMYRQMKKLFKFKLEIIKLM